MFKQHSLLENVINILWLKYVTRDTLHWPLAVTAIECSRSGCWVTEFFYYVVGGIVYRLERKRA